MTRKDSPHPLTVHRQVLLKLICLFFQPKMYRNVSPRTASIHNVELTLFSPCPSEAAKKVFLNTQGLSGNRQF